MRKETCPLEEQSAPGRNATPGSRSPYCTPSLGDGLCWRNLELEHCSGGSLEAQSVGWVEQHTCDTHMTCM